MCIRLRETAGPSLHFVPSGAAGLVSVLSSTWRKHCARASPTFFGSNAAGPERRMSPFARYNAARVAVVRIIRGEVADDFRGEIKLHRIAKCFRHGRDFRPVVRPVGAFAEPRYLRDVRGQVVRRTFTGLGFGGRDTPEPRPRPAMCRRGVGACSLTLPYVHNCRSSVRYWMASET